MGNKTVKTTYKAGAPLTLEQAKALTRGTTLYSVHNRNSDGTCQRWRVSGQVKTWKRDASRVEFPIKHGLYMNDSVSQHDLHLVSLEQIAE